MGKHGFIGTDKRAGDSGKKNGRPEITVPQQHFVKMCNPWANHFLEGEGGGEIMLEC
jgi:hypothetical protein